jgi:hypothetical protein
MEPGEGSVLEPQIVKLSAEAKLRWVEWWDAHATDMNSQHLPAYLIGAWGKLRTCLFFFPADE